MHDKIVSAHCRCSRRIASYECQSWHCARCQNTYVLGTHNLQAIDNVGFRPVCFIDLDSIANLNILQALKKTIAMACNTNISIMAEVSCSCDMPNSTV